MTDGFGYFLEQATRPQTIGYSLLDSPVGLAAWMLDHDTDSYYKISRAFVDRGPVGNLTRDNILDNITLYWLTGTGASAARWYWEFGRFLAAAGAAGKAPRTVSVPVGFTTFPGEIWAARAAGSRRSTPTSRTSTRSTAATSPPGRSRSSSPPRCGLHSAHCANDAIVFGSAARCPSATTAGPAAKQRTLTCERARMAGPFFIGRPLVPSVSRSLRRGGRDRDGSRVGRAAPELCDLGGEHRGSRFGQWPGRRRLMLAMSRNA
jgi:hypothetical protein